MHAGIHPPGSRHPPGADTPPRSRHPPGQAPPRSRHPPQQTATAADGTHPTGMHSCCESKTHVIRKMFAYRVHEHLQCHNFLYPLNIKFNSVMRFCLYILFKREAVTVCVNEILDPSMTPLSFRGMYVRTDFGGSAGEVTRLYVNDVTLLVTDLN